MAVFPGRITKANLHGILAKKTTPFIVSITTKGVNLCVNFYAFLYALKSIAKSLPLIMPSALTSANAT